MSWVSVDNKPPVGVAVLLCNAFGESRTLKIADWTGDEWRSRDVTPVYESHVTHWHPINSPLP